MAEASKPRATASTRVFGDYLIMLVTPCVMAWYFNGDRAVRVMLACVAATVAADFIGSAVFTGKSGFNAAASVFTGLAISLMLPAAVPLYVPVFAGLFAVFAVKLPFGGKNMPFVPAAAGFAFVSICFKDEVFTYVSEAVSAGDKFLGGSSVAALLKTGDAIHMNIVNGFDIVSGNVAGPMGTTCAVVLLGCMAFMAFRRPKALCVTAGVVIGAALTAFIFPRTSLGRPESVFLELFSGSLLFCAVFLATDPSTMPQNNLFRLIYGIYTGVLCLLMRHTGVYEEGVCFAVLLANGTWPVLHGFLTGLKSKIILSGKSPSRLNKKEAQANE